MVVLERKVDQKALYRRDGVKPDGRSLYLYGYEPHTLPMDEDLPATERHAAELRYHPLRGEWAAYAAHRQNRTFQPSKASTASNPFAPYKAGEPPTEIPFTDFEVAVFDNRFASFQPDMINEPQAIVGLDIKPAKGRCEVVVYSPNAEGSFATLGTARRRLVLEAWIDRYEALRAAGHDYILVFENRGAETGATLHHPHGQIYAFDFVPKPQASAAKAFKNGYNLASAIAGWDKGYVIAENTLSATFCPPYARFPYEAWVAPKRRVAGPWEFTNDEAADYAECLGVLIARYDALFDRPMPFMMTHHVAPKGAEDSFHFTTQFYPILRSADRVKFLAGVEQSTGMFTVDIMPEAAASALRAANPEPYLVV